MQLTQEPQAKQPKLRRCPKCAEAGQRSQLHMDGSTGVTSEFALPYYDEEGKYHEHDPNTYTYHFKCTNGHSWTLSEKFGCRVCGQVDFENWEFKP